MLLCSEAWAWQTNINGTAPSSLDQANAVAVDANGDVLAAGLTDNIGTGPDFTVVKPAGKTQVTSNHYDGQGGFYDQTL